MDNTMRAAVLESPGHFTIQQVARPPAEEHYLRVRLRGCGICGSNLPLFQGREWFHYPLTPGQPGHEGWGVVDAVGSKVHSFVPGDKVAFLSYHAFAEYDLVEDTAAIKLPPSLSGKALPGEPLACAINVFRRSQISEGQIVIIIGVGFLGAILIQLATKEKAEVIAISRRPFSLEVAERCGARHRFGLDQSEDIATAIARITKRDGSERVIECAGTQRTLDLAAALTGIRGQLVIAGFHQDGPRQVDMRSWNWRGLDVINAHERDPVVYLEGMRAAVDALANERIDLCPLLTHRFPLSQINEAFDTMGTRPDGFLKAYIDMTMENP
jgi:threonine dehydrogenase-like Zn-dependent dehydrogenase